MAIAICVLLVAPVACTSSTTDTSATAPVFVANPDAGMLPVEVGTGFSTFEAVTDGEPVDVTAGPQGGFHIWTAVVVKDAQLDSVQIALSARFADDESLAGRPSRVAVPLVPLNGMREHAGMTNFVNDPGAVRGKRIVLRAEVTAADGRAGTAECIVVPR